MALPTHRILQKAVFFSCYLDAVKLIFDKQFPGLGLSPESQIRVLITNFQRLLQEDYICLNNPELILNNFLLTSTSIWALSGMSKYQTL